MQITEENLKNLQSQILLFEEQYQCLRSSVQLMAVSKKQPAKQIKLAYQFGQRLFGESYVQEALEKMEVLVALDKIEWHFIGPIQSNKTRDIAAHFNWVHSIDRLKIMNRLNDQRESHLPPINICLQVNIDNEPTKSGFKPEDIMDAARQALTMPHLTLRGIMAIPKPSHSLLEQREAFSRVQQVFKQVQALSKNVDTLSMGMSADLEAAIAEGSTIVRIGTAIFGQRHT